MQIVGFPMRWLIPLYFVANLIFHGYSFHMYISDMVTVYQRTPDIAIDLSSRKLGRGALRGQFLFYYFSYKIKVGLSNMENTSLIH